MISSLFILFVVIGIFYSILNNNVELINNIIINSPKEIGLFVLNYSCLILLWSGILEMANKNGVLDFISRRMNFITLLLFPRLRKNKEALKYININIITNIFGLGSVATPSGLKAMKLITREDRKVNINHITLLLLNTSGLTLIPSSIILLRSNMGAEITTEIIPYIIICTSMSTFTAIVISIFARKFY